LRFDAKWTAVKRCMCEGRIPGSGDCSLGDTLEVGSTYVVWRGTKKVQRGREHRDDVGDHAEENE